MILLAENSGTNMGWLVLLIIFIILLIVITKTLQQTKFFSDQTALILAICVSLLSVMGLVQQFGGIGNDGDVIENVDNVERNSLDFLLIPYTAMALSILLMLLLLAIAWLIKAKINSRLRQHTDSKITHHTDDLQERQLKPSNPNIAPSKKEERFRDELRKHK